jgi:hypothetical protein
MLLDCLAHTIGETEINTNFAIWKISLKDLGTT